MKQIDIIIEPKKRKTTDSLSNNVFHDKDDTYKKTKASEKIKT